MSRNAHRSTGRKANTEQPRPMAMLPSFPDSLVWPYRVVTTDGAEHRINASSERAAGRVAIARSLQGKRKGFKVRVATIETMVVTSEMMHRILD